MKKTIIATLAAAIILSCGVPLLATVATLQKGGDLIPIQGFAPNPKKDKALTVNSTVVDMSNDVAWQAYGPADCKYRIMSTATKAGITKTLPATTWTGKVVNHIPVNRAGVFNNHSTAFTNFSGCTSWTLERM